MPKAAATEVQPTEPPRNTNGQFAKAISQAGLPAVVEKWNPNPQFERADTPLEASTSSETEDTTPAETPSGKEKVETPAAETEKTQETPAEGEEAAETAKPAAEAKPDEARAARLAQIRESIDKQKAKLGLEDAARAEKERADKLAAELEQLKKADFDTLLKFRGLDRRTIEDQLLMGGDLTAATPQTEQTQAQQPTANPEVAALRARLEAIEQGEQQTRVQQALSWARDTLKDADVPLVKVERDGYARVLRTAHDAWLASGKKGEPKDFFADAAAIVDDEIRSERPELAQLVDASKVAKKPAPKEEEAEEQPEAPAAKPRATVGKRVGATPSEKPVKLPRDRDAKDREIKKRMGWD